MSNYKQMAAQARRLFLTYDQEEMIRRWDLEADDVFLYLTYFGEPCAIRRDTGQIMHPVSSGGGTADSDGTERDLPQAAGSRGEPANYCAADRDLTKSNAPRGGRASVNETMVLFDLLTFAKERPVPTGEWESISALGGIIGAGHDRNLEHRETAERFAGRTEQLREACRLMGAEEIGRADVGAAFSVFGGFRIALRFWDGDDEFPPSVRYFFDHNALRFMHYETLWYVMASLEERLFGLMDKNFLGF